MGRETRESGGIALGGVETHAGLLIQPASEDLLYKVMAIEDLLRSIDLGYLHFNRVDLYTDFPVADPHDGEQLHADRDGNSEARFEKAPGFSAADYYDRSRARTYACCFSLENADYLWTTYGNKSALGKVCVVFAFGKLRETLNHNFSSGGPSVLVDGVALEQLLTLNYGVVRYVPWRTDRANADVLPNPIVYSHLKDERFSREREFRVTLSAPGVFAGFQLPSGEMIEFPRSLQVPFDFKAGLAAGTISHLLMEPDRDPSFLGEALRARGLGSPSVQNQSKGAV
jgi:hypothetical protein